MLQYCARHRIVRPYKENEQSYIESFNRTLRKECLGWASYRVEELPTLTTEVWAATIIIARISGAPRCDRP